MDWDGSPGGRGYRAPYGAKNSGGDLMENTVGLIVLSG